MSGKQSAAMDKAQKAVTEGKMTATQAAAKFGLAVNSIYRRPWYKAWRKEAKK